MMTITPAAADTIQISRRRRVLGLAVPIMLASLSQTLMSLIDIAMVGRIGIAAVAAVGLGSTLALSASEFLNAIQAGVQTVVARRVGEGRYGEVAPALRNSLYFSLITGSAFAVLFIWATNFLLPAINPDRSVVTLGIQYLRLRGLSFGLVMAGYVFYAFFNGISKPRVHLVVTVLANTVNVILNYGLIFGRLGFPEMGAPGAGLATTLSSGIAFLLYAVVTMTARIRTQFPGIWIGRGGHGVLRRILRLSLPASIQELGGMIGFAVFKIIIGWISTTALAATTIVINILSFSFMPAMGFLYATQTLVSESMGREDVEGAKAFARTASRLCMLLMGAMGVLFILFPRIILHVFTINTEIVEAGITPLRILGFVQVIDAIGMTYHGALRGAGDNVFPAVADIIIMWAFFLPAVYISGIHLGWGLNGSWIALAIYIAAYAIMAYFRFHYGPWKRIVV
jgi:putative MATE family efflux protein